MKRQRIWPVLLAAAFGVATLSGLGVWQVKRLAWKEALIAEIDERVKAAPVSLLDAMNATAGKEYLHVATAGRFLAGPPLRRMASSNGGPGYELLQPFLSADGIFVLVDRGSVAIDDTDPAIAPITSQNTTISGILRLHNKGRGFFDGDNDVKGNLWVWWDVAAMLAAANPPAAAQSAPFILQLLPSPDLPQKPLVAAPKIELSNNHLGYAITWFGLAAALIAVAGAYIWRVRSVPE